MVNQQNEQSKKLPFLPKAISCHALPLIVPRCSQPMVDVPCNALSQALSSRGWATNNNPARPLDVLVPPWQVPAAGQTRQGLAPGRLTSRVLPGKPCCG